MTRLVNGLAGRLAGRSSRRGFLGRAGQLLLGVVGGSALLGLMAAPAGAQTPGRSRCGCRNPCLGWATCSCGNYGIGGQRWLNYHWHCPQCGNYQCEWYECSKRKCG